MKRSLTQKVILSFFLLGAASAFGSPSPGHERHPAISGAPNFRDLGGYRTADGRSVKWRQLYRSDALSDLTASDQAMLAGLNVGRIVDFRNAEERMRAPDVLPANIGERIVYIPIGERAKQQTPEEAERAAAVFNALDEKSKLDRIDKEMVRTYPLLVHDYSREYRTWMRGLLDTPNSAQVFHCTGGADRTGFAAALVLLALGVPENTVIEDYLLTNKYLYTPSRRGVLDRRTTMRLPATLKVRAQYLEIAFAEMRKEYGSIDGYLNAALGIDSEFRARLRDRFLE